jgi:tetratricopeptide (TPR) repeat protein
MAPEQAAGDSGLITAAVDVYGLGALLYEVLTGRPPFAAATADATLGQVRRDEPVPPRRLQPTVPRDLQTICLKCLRKEPGRRYATARDLADDLRRFRAGEPIRARPVGAWERAVRWCRRQPALAGALAALVVVFLAGLAGVLWQWQRATRNAAQADRNAADYLRERDLALQAKARADHHLSVIRTHTNKLKRLGRDLLQRPGQSGTGQAVLEEALAIYKELLPAEGGDLKVRLAAALLFHEIADIHHHLGQSRLAAEAYGRQAGLLSGVQAEKPGNRGLYRQLADAYRWQGNELRDLGEMRKAREAYDKAARIHEELLREFPKEALYHVALANTLFNTTFLLSHRDQAEEVEALYHRAVKLNRAAVGAARDNPDFQAELALVLENQGLFFLNTGRGPRAEAAVGEAVEILQRVRAGGRMKGRVERYLARTCVTLARVRAATGKAREAEESYLQAVKLLDRPGGELPTAELDRAQLAQTLAAQADFLRDADRRGETEAIRQRVIRLYETLRADFSENLHYRRNLVRGYLELVNLLCDLGRPTEADAPYRKALELESADHDVSNELAWFLATSSEPRLRDAALAVRLAQKAVAARRQSANYRNTLGVAHYRNGDDKQAIAELEESMRLSGGGDGFDWFFLAMAHWRLGDHDKARTWFDRAVKWMDRHQPRNVELLRFRAEAEALLGQAGKP